MATSVPSTTASSATTPELVESGAPPRARLSFRFAEGTRERAHLIVESRRERRGQVLSDERLELWLKVHYPSSSAVALSVERASTPTGDSGDIETAVGTRFTLQVGANGGIDPPQLASSPQRARPEALAQVRSAVEMIAAHFVVFAPQHPIGPGARWKHGPLEYALSARRRDVFVIERQEERVSQQATQRGVVPVHETQSHRIQAVSNGIARHIESELRSAGPQQTTLATRITFAIVQPASPLPVLTEPAR